ncbi:MAG TPA: hypothetical protein VFA59_10345 [Vicinamibacterales bacterium]|nr:hypothetical protein [Vicinamibacterales bacterium]
MTRVLVRSLSAALLLSTPAFAQEPKSAALAKQLTAALDAGKLDAVAAKDPESPDVFYAALYFPNAQLLVVSAKYSAPQILDARLAKKEFRDTYIDLNSASIPSTKVFIMDVGADGLKPKGGDNQGVDTVDDGGKTMAFDGDWKKQKISEQDYQKAFSNADGKYSQILTALIAQLKKTS